MRARREAPRAKRVVGGVCGVVVDVAVDLEREAQLGAVKVGDETGDDLLSPELQAEDAAVTQELPSGSLGDRRVSTKTPGECELGRVARGCSDHAR